MAEKEDKKNQDKEKSDDEAKEIIPPLHFSSLVLPFFMQAVIKLGLAKDPITNKEHINLELVKRLIDLLDLLKERTQGNLKPEEEKFLDGCLHQLKTAYLEKSEVIKL